MDSLLSNLDIHRHEIVLMGDFNIDFLDKKTPLTKKLQEMIKQFGLRQLIKEPTCYSENNNSCTSLGNLDDIEKLFYRGLRICASVNNFVSKSNLRAICKI